MSNNQKKFYLTTPIYYVNARPHIGHAYTTIVADVIARRHRLLGDNTFFLTGTDEHGQKIERSAAAAGIPPQQFADQVSASFEALWKRMGITNDDYIRTTSEKHKKGVQKLFQLLRDRDAIYLSTYTGQYSVGEEMFIDGPPGTIGPDGKPTETVTEENFFFRLSDYQLRLINLIESNELLIQPEARRNEVLSFLRGNISAATNNSESEKSRVPHLRDSLIVAKVGEAPQTPTETTEPGAPRPASGTWEEPPTNQPESTIAYSEKGTPYLPGALKDLSISRSSFKWGIPVPGDEKHVIYVWLDALANYMTAIGYGSEDPEQQAKFEKYWPADLHLVGKEIIRFHCVYWPAFLMAANLPLPKAITAHGWLLFEDSKMSKSRGNIVRTETILEAFGTLLPKPAETSSTSSESAGLQSTSGGSTDLQSTSGGSTGLQPGESTPAEKGALAPGRSSDADAETNRLVKGTASAVPQQTAKGAALAAEVRPSSPSQKPSSEAWAHEQDLFAADVLRYFLLREIPFGQDGSFSFDALVQRYNSDLANGYGNLVSRTLAMIWKYLDGIIPESPFQSVPKHIDTLRVDGSALTAIENAAAGFELNQFEMMLTSIWWFVADIDSHITSNQPWKIASSHAEDKDQKLADVLYQAAESIRIITALLYPILPYATSKVWAQLGLGDIEEAARKGELKNLKWGGLTPGTKLGPLSPIFPRAPKELIQIMTDMENPTQKPEPSKLIDEKTTHTAPVPTDPAHPGAAPRTSAFTEADPGTTVAGSHALSTERPGTPPHAEAPASGPFAASAAASTTPDTPQIAIDDFVKVDLRVAQIVVAERIPKADKLLRLEVDLGYEKRQILSGIAEWYTPEELIGRRIIVITNLAPRKMRGLESHGMLLAASNGEDGKPILATFAEDIALGSRLK